MAKDGVIVINTFASSKVKKLETDIFESNFDKYYNLSTKQTRVMIASKNKLPDFNEIFSRIL